jgi:hypothetical protein
MARPRTTKKYGRSIYSPKKGRRYSKKQLYKYYGGDDTKNPDNPDNLDQGKLSEIDGEGNVNAEGAAEVSSEVAAEGAAKDATEVSSEGAAAEPSTASKFVEGAKDVANLAYTSAKEEIFGNEDEQKEAKQSELNEDDGEDQGESDGKEQKVDSVEIEEVKEEITEIRSKVEAIIEKEYEESKEKVKTLEEENKRLNDELLSIYRANSTINPSNVSNQPDEQPPQNDMFSNSNGLNDSNNEQVESVRSDSPVEEEASSSLVDEAPLGSPQGVSESESNLATSSSSQDGLFKDSTQGAGQEDPFKDSEPGLGEGEGVGEGIAKDVGAGITENADANNEANKLTQVASAELKNPPAIPLGESLPSSQVSKLPPQLEENNNQRQLIMGGAKSKRHRRTIRKSKKGHKYKYRYVY